MKELKITILARQCSLEELDPERRALVEKAKEATRGSYAPYSGFNVGAAISLADGTTVCGANQENAAFSDGTCAERSALFYAGANHPGVPLKRIAVAAAKEEVFQAKPISPCGSCRQALLEYENLYGNIEVILYGTETVYILPSVASLLPLCFTEF